MPELPEVEITKRSLNQIIKPPAELKGITFFRKDLRFKIPIKKLEALEGQKIKKIVRRAKFILFETPQGFILSHLGMTGSWRLEGDVFQKRKHDHIILSFGANKNLVFNDPRRFGEFDFQTQAELDERFKNYGPEPLDSHTDFDALTTQFRKLQTSIKVALMNQKYIVGVGNIYANEALFRAGIDPKKLAAKVPTEKYARLWQEVRLVLEEALQAGGSTLQDFRNGYDQKGDFQNRFKIYDRENDACLQCSGKIKSIQLGGRSTYFCRICQK